MTTVWDHLECALLDSIINNELGASDIDALEGE